MDIVKEFKYVPYPEYMRKQGKNQPIEAYYFLVKYVYKLLKSKRHVLLSTQRVQSKAVVKKHVNKTIEPEIKHVNEKLNLVLL